MAIRVLDFADGFESETQPTASSTVAVTGSLGSPSAVTTAGFTPSGAADELAFIVGSPGAVDVTANPQIAAGTFVGQKIDLGWNLKHEYSSFENGNGLLIDGPWLAENGAVLKLFWDGANWKEEARQ